MNYLVMDLETTGVNPLVDEPVQFAGIIKDDYGRTRSTINKLIKTDVPIAPGALAVHGISQEVIITDGITPAKMCGVYENLIWEFKPITLIGYNIISFDLPMWQIFLMRHNPKKFKIPPVCAVLDVMHQCSVFFKTNKWPKLSAAAKTLGITFAEDNLHDALEDVKLTWEVFEAIKNVEVKS